MEIKMTALKPIDQEKYNRAKKKVDDIKSFHRHLTAYIVVNIFVLLIKLNIGNWVAMEELGLNFSKWLDWNIILTPLLWGIGLAAHAVYVYRYKFKFIKAWEEKKIRELMDKEDQIENNRFE